MTAIVLTLVLLLLPLMIRRRIPSHSGSAARTHARTCPFGTICGAAPEGCSTPVWRSLTGILLFQGVLSIFPWRVSFSSDCQGHLARDSVEGTGAPCPAAEPGGGARSPSRTQQPEDPETDAYRVRIRVSVFVWDSYPDE